MRRNLFFNFGILILVGIFLIGIISGYTYSNPSYSQFNNAGGLGGFASYSAGKIDAELCSAGTDFILQINPFDCEPSVVRSDLLEENDVTVFCKLGATQINPLIDVQSIRSIFITGKYPREIKSVGYFPSQSALGYTSENVLGDVALNDMGYVAITLRQNANESSMPDYVSGNLSAKIHYDVENAFGVGQAEFYLPVLSDNDFNNRINQYSFWEGRGYLRAESVGDNNAIIGIYSDINSVGGLSGGADKQRVSQLNLEKGQSSGEIYIPGFSPCLASLKVRLNGLENPETTAKLKINSDYVEITDGSSFLDGNCRVTNIKKDGMNQRVSIHCKEDDDNSNFDLRISPNVKLKIGEADTKDYSVGDRMYASDDNIKSVYLGYVGSKGDTERLEDLYVVLIAIPEDKARLSEDEISSVATQMNLLFSDVKTGSSVVDVSENVLKKFSGGILTGMKWAVSGTDLRVVDLKGSSGVVSSGEDFKGKIVSLAGFSEAQDSDFISITEEDYTLEKTVVGDVIPQDAYLIKNENGEETGLYLLVSKKGSPRMILSSSTIMGFSTLGTFYGKDCETHAACSQYLLSSNDLNPVSSYSWFFENLIYGEVKINDNHLILKRISFDSISGEKYYEYYQDAITDFETILNSFSGEEYSLEVTYGEESLYQSILLSEKLGQRKTMKDLCVEFAENYPDSIKPMKICEDAYKISNSEISSREVLVNGKIKDISFEGIYEPSFDEYGAEILVRGPNGKLQTYQLRKDETVYLGGFRGGSVEEETTIFTYDDKQTKPVYYKFDEKWLWSLDKSNWRSDVPEVGTVVSKNNWDIIDQLKNYNFADGEALLIGEFYKATSESTSLNEFIRLGSVDEDSARIYINAQGETGFNRLLSTNTYTLKRGEEGKSFGSQYFFTLSDTNIKKNARVSVIPSFNYQESNTTFEFKIGIEKRAIQLSDDQIDKKIKGLNRTIEDWTKISSGLNTFNDALGKTCLATGAVLTVKNFIENSDGKSIARQRVMQGSEGWDEFCQKEVQKEDSIYSSVDDCFFDNSNKIDEQVGEVYSAIKKQDDEIKAIQDATPKTNLNTINEEEFMKEYSKQGVKSLNGIGDENGDFIVEGKTEKLDISEIQNIVLNYNGWESGNYNKEDLREIELYANLVNDQSVDKENKELYSQRLYSLLYDVRVNAETNIKTTTLSEEYGMPVDLFVLGGKDAEKRGYNGGVYGNLPEDLKSKITGFEDSDPVQILPTSQGDIYIIFLQDLGEPILPIRKNSDKIKLIYDENGDLIADEDKLPEEFKKIYFQKYDASSYNNKYLNDEVKYYEEEPYVGYPAVVPLDTKKGWYAGTKPKLGVGSSIRAYDESGRVNSFWLCNVGPNGLEEFSKDSFGDDECRQINVGVPGTVYDQFGGLKESEVTKLVYDAVDSIEKAQRAYKNGLRRVRINGVTYKVGEPAVGTPAVSCTDYMSPKDCQILFNVCDPVVCPSSRCDFGGDYPVKDVVQSGVIGSVALCAPNAKEGILLPVCTTGIQAGLDSWISVEKAYRDCLQENLENGKTVGICDEIHSVYACEFFWRQAMPLAKLAVPKILNKIAGEGTRGGGEYLGLQSSWDNARDSLNYFTQYYASESYEAFKLRSVDQAGGEVCKNFASVVYPSGGELLDSLTSPRSPPQFTGNFDEIQMTTVTNPPTSHYKVYYHIYAGTDSGAYYQVYLTGGSSSSYYQDTEVRRVVGSGYVVAGDYVDETPDITAPSGYTTMCIVVNGQEECGFKQVSTSFAVNYVNDLYLAEQSTTKVTTESECVSGTASLYSLLNPNAESIVDDLIDPALYQKGIIRVCATDNPGQGTDGAIGTEDVRWRDVGYCGNTNIRCWLDTDSVKNAIRSLNIENDVLNETAQDYVNSLIASGEYIDNQKYSEKVAEINSEEDSEMKVNLINEILDKVFFSNQKAELYLLRGLAFGSLAQDEYAKVEKFQSDYFYDTGGILEGEEIVPASTRVQIVALAKSLDKSPYIKISSLSSSEKTEIDKSNNIWTWNGIPIIQDYDSNAGCNCFDSVIHLYRKAGVSFAGFKYCLEDKLVDVDKDGCEKNKGISKENLEGGDILSIRWGTESNPTIHNVVFLDWKENGKAEVFDWIGTTDTSKFTESLRTKIRGFRVFEMELKFDEKSEIGTVYAVGKPSISSSSGSECSGGVCEVPIKEGIYKEGLYKKINYPYSSFSDVLMDDFSEKEQSVINSATECKDCGGKVLDFNSCDIDECKAIALKTEQNCVYEFSLSSLFGSCSPYNSDEEKNLEEKAIANAKECNDCGGPLYDQNFCDENECNLIGPKVSGGCYYENLFDLNGGQCYTQSEKTFFDNFDLEYKSKFSINELEDIYEAEYCKDCRGNSCDAGLCEAFGEFMGITCTYSSGQCYETSEYKIFYNKGALGVSSYVPVNKDTFKIYEINLVETKFVKSPSGKILYASNEKTKNVFEGDWVLADSLRTNVYELGKNYSDSKLRITWDHGATYETFPNVDFITYKRFIYNGKDTKMIKGMGDGNYYYSIDGGVKWKIVDSNSLINAYNLASFVDVTGWIYENDLPAEELPLETDETEDEEVPADEQGEETRIYFKKNLLSGSMQLVDENTFKIYEIDFKDTKFVQSPDKETLYVSEDFDEGDFGGTWKLADDVQTNVHNSEKNYTILNLRITWQKSLTYQTFPLVNVRTYKRFVYNGQDTKFVKSNNGEDLYYSVDKGYKWSRAESNSMTSSYNSHSLFDLFDWVIDVNQ